MKTMAVTEFKAHALRVMAEVAKSKEPVLVTKRGKPLVEVIPHRDGKDGVPQLGTLAHTLVQMGDVVSPLGPDDWEACK